MYKFKLINQILCHQTDIHQTLPHYLHYYQTHLQVLHKSSSVAEEKKINEGFQLKRLNSEHVNIQCSYIIIIIIYETTIIL